MTEGSKVEANEKKQPEKKYRLHDMGPWQKRRLFGSIAAVVLVFGIFLIATCCQLYQDKVAEDAYWNQYLQEVSPELQEKVEEFSGDATHVETAVYLEQVRAVDIKNSQFEVVLQVGYRWEGDPELDFSTNETVHFYKGKINGLTLLDEYHEGSTNYQLIRYDVVINKQFWTPRFPLESHQLRIYLEPSENVNSIVLVAAADESYTNPNLGITGYQLTRFDVAQAVIAYDDPLLNPAFDEYGDNSSVYKTEVMAQLEINREGIGLFIKCFIALYGTTAWILLCLYICTFRRVDPLGMIGAAFFGSVSNIMVGANLVPDALQMGLLEYGNLFGVGIIIAGTSVVISINAIRKEHGNEAFAQFYGRVMLALFVVLVVVGNLALPLSSML